MQQRLCCNTHQRQPIVFQEGEHLRLWFSPTRKSEDIHLLSSCPVEELDHIVESTPMYLGCAVRTSSLSLPVELCRPDGSCGLQFACVVLLEPESWHPDPHSTGYFDSPERKHLLYTTLEQWVQASGIPPDTLLKIRGTLAWLNKTSPGMLPSRFWFSNVDVHRVLRSYRRPVSI